MPRTLLLIGALLLPAAAGAQPVSGFYLGGAGGVTLPQGHVDAKPAPNLSLDPGPAAVGSAGYGFGNGVRAEVEGDYRSNAIAGARGGPATGGFNGGQPTH
jgi:hypothetical protein